jgi:formylmethanofuran dehydrogenase subunit E
MGRYALELSGSEGHFGISAEVHSPLKPPASCFIDGVQLGSGCTLGKRNIEVREFQGPAYVIFKTEEGEILTLRIRPGIPELITRLIREKGVEEAGEILLEENTQLLFSIDGPSE